MSVRPIPALSLWQPWASLVAGGVKTIETRTWAPHKDLIGTRMAFASTGTMPKEAKDALRHGTPGFQALLDGVRATGHRISWDRTKLVHDLPLGRVLCTTVVAGGYPMIDPAHGLLKRCLAVTPSRLLLIRPEGDLDVTDQYPYGIFEPGRVAWHLVDIRPVVGDHPAKGRQGVWNWRPTGPYDLLSS